MEMRRILVVLIILLVLYNLFIGGGFINEPIHKTDISKPGITLLDGKIHYRLMNSIDLENIAKKTRYTSTPFKLPFEEKSHNKELEMLKDNRSYPVIDGHGTGLKLLNSEQLKKLLGKKLILNINNKNLKLPSTVRWDLDPHFPPVGNQEYQGSCAAWAVSYYQNGFLQRMIYNWTDDTLAHLMSPSWTYNKVNGGWDQGSTFEGNIELIESVGDSTLENMSYNPSDYISWGSESAWRDAPKHRIGDYYMIDFENDTGIENIKKLLDEGYLVTFAIDAYQFDNAFADGNYIISSAEYSSTLTNHAQTIVGYDDSVTDDGDVGAFRVVNSWGSNWGDHGFYWVTYKALEKKVSQGWPYAYVIMPISDKPYNPKLLATWHFSSPGSRDASIKITIGDANSTWYRTPIWNGGTHDFPEFMALDITELYSVWKNSSYQDRFYLKIGIENSGIKNGEIDSFKIEYYPYGYKFLWQNTTESPDVPVQTPATIKSSKLQPSEYFPYLYADSRHTIFGKYYHLKVLSLIVGNAGTAQDTLLISGEATNGWSLQFSSNTVALNPNETKIINVLINPPSDVNLGDKTTIKIKAVSQGNESKLYILHLTQIYLANIIYIDGDFDFKYQAKLYGWNGNGSAENPYVISGYIIDAKNISFGIYIRNTRVHFIIRDCEIYHTGFYYSWPTPYGEGIWLYNVMYGEIENNKLHNNGNITALRGGDGIYLEFSSLCKIYNNTIYNGWIGITLSFSDNNLIKQNTVKNNGEWGIYLYRSVQNRIYNNIMKNNGIELYGDISTYVLQNISENNTVNGKPVYYGTHLNNITISKYYGEVILGKVRDVKIENMTLLAPRYGIQIGYSQDIRITNVTLEGISIQGSKYVTIENIIAIGGIVGVVPISSSYITVQNSVFKPGGSTGIFLYGTTHSILQNNLIEKRNIEIVYSEYNLIENNTIRNSTGQGGIYLYYSKENIFKHNALILNIYGIYLNSYSTNNIFKDNLISKNLNYGVYIVSTSSDNQFYNNTFIYNHKSTSYYQSMCVQAYDDGQNNYWNVSGKGNYWYDWANNNDTNDQNHDGVVDWPYHIDGSANAKDYYPLKNSSMVMLDLSSAPVNLSATAGENYVYISWEKPKDNGHASISKYIIYRNGRALAVVSGTQLWYNDTDVFPGVTYTYYVTAVNFVGESPSSNEVQSTPGEFVPELTSMGLGVILAVTIIYLKMKYNKSTGKSRWRAKMQE